MDRYAITENGQLLCADSQGRLPASVREVQGFAYTLAPPAYDYWYTHTVAKTTTQHGEWRLVAVTDMKRFVEFQQPRYSSGIFASFALPDEARRESFTLPPHETLLPC